jgi:Yip1 domain
MASATVPPQPAPVSSFGRIFGVFFNPKPTFESIAQRPTWVLPVLIILAVSLVTVAVISQRVGWQTVIEKQMANNPRAQKQMEQMTPDQREKAMNMQMKLAPVIGYVSVIVGTILGVVVVAAIFLAVFNLASGTKIGFSVSLAVVAYSWMPFVLAGLLGILILFIKDPSTVDIEHLVASNPGALLADGSPRWMVSLLTSLDLFTFWVLVLQGVGYSATNPKKISFGKALGYVFGVWIVFVLIKVGIAAAFS